MHEQLAISSALVAIAGSVLVGVGAVATRDYEWLILVGGVVGIFGLYHWYVELRSARLRIAQARDARIQAVIDEHRREGDSKRSEESS